MGWPIHLHVWRAAACNFEQPAGNHLFTIYFTDEEVIWKGMITALSPRSFSTMPLPLINT